MALEVAIAVAAVLLFVLTYGMFWTGLAGSARVLTLRRCHNCGRLTPTTAAAVPACAICRHERLNRRLPHHRLHHYLPKEW